jgi:Acyclic terpene utilisation family protein AtuA
MKTVRLGSGAGYSGDRIDPAVELARFGKLDYLVFECLAERTIGIAQQNKRNGISDGYDPLLVERMRAVLSHCVSNSVTIVSNMGAADPLAAAKKTCEIAHGLGLHGLRIAAVSGDDVLTHMPGDYKFMESGEPIKPFAGRLVSANAYLGVGSILEALAQDADVVLTGRAADPSLFIAPLIHEFKWDTTHWDLLGQGTVVGHLLECAGQLTGGYFADPGYKDVPDLAHLGFPLAEVSADGSAIFSKVEGSGGCLTRSTCIEQLLYEIQDPTSYITPDVVADFSNVQIEEIGKDLVRVTGGAGKPRPDTLKVSVGYHEGFIGEGQISYAGPGALARAHLAQEILAERLGPHAINELRFDLIGLNSIHGPNLSPSDCEPYEVRLRAAGRSDSREQAAIIPREVEALYTNGPAGGGGVSTSVRDVLAIQSTLIPAELPQPSIHFEVS